MLRVLARSLLVMGVILFFLSLTSLDFLSTHVGEMIATLAEMRSRQPLLLGLGFIALYILIATVGLPGGAIMSLTAGYAFGFPLGFFLVMLSILVSLCSTWLLIKASGLRPEVLSFAFYQRLRQVISESPYHILLFIRLIPVAPFYLVNLLTAASGISFRIYTITGVAGLIPSSLALTLIGQGIGKSLLENDYNVTTVLVHPMVLYPSLILALMSLLALVYKRTLRH